MFKKLRNRFLILNMVITSLVMLTAFVVIYVITYNNTQNENNKKLQAIPETSVEISDGLIVEQMTYFSSSDSPTFFLKVDLDGNILSRLSLVDLPNEVYRKAVKLALDNPHSSAVVDMENRQWQYQVLDQNSISIDTQGDSIENENYWITFLDVSESQKMLFNLIITLVFVGSGMLLAIFFVSLYFANCTIKPISESWEKQKRFVADASHELKTPLSIINANVDALYASKAEPIDSQIKWLDYIRIGSDRMAKLINDMLSLARLEESDTAILENTFELGYVVSEIVSSMEAPISSKNISISCLIEPNVIIKSDKEKIKMVVSILFDNAIKYTPEDGTIDISLKKSKKQVLFIIKNSGKGIAKQNLTKVFDRFYRADIARTQENAGYGLGLSIAKTIIDSFGGEIHVASVENEQTTFTFSLGVKT